MGKKITDLPAATQSTTADTDVTALFNNTESKKITISELRKVLLADIKKELAQTNDNLSEKKANSFCYCYSQGNDKKYWYEMLSYTFSAGYTNNFMVTALATRLYGDTTPNPRGCVALLTINLRITNGEVSIVSSRFHVSKLRKAILDPTDFFMITADNENRTIKLWAQSIYTYDGWRIDFVKDINTRGGGSTTAYSLTTHITPENAKTEMPLANIIIRPTSSNDSLFADSSNWVPTSSDLAISESAAVFYSSNFSEKITGNAYGGTGTISRISETAYRGMMRCHSSSGSPINDIMFEYTSSGGYVVSDFQSYIYIIDSDWKPTDSLKANGMSKSFFISSTISSNFFGNIISGTPSLKGIIYRRASDAYDWIIMYSTGQYMYQLTTTNDPNKVSTCWRFDGTKLV